MTMLRVRLAMYCVLFLGSGCQKSTPAQAGGYSNWLQNCEQNADCSDAMCVCGICTEPCDTEASCEREDSPEAVCVNPSGLETASECGTSVRQRAMATGLCFVACTEDEDCGDEGRSCMEGACVNHRALMGTQASDCGVDGGCDSESLVDAGGSETVADAGGSETVVDAGGSETVVDAGDAGAGDGSTSRDGEVEQGQMCLSDGGLGLNCDGCPIDQDACDGVCTSLAYDSNNCGACGNSCGDRVCDHGRCRDATGFQTAVRIDDASGDVVGDPRITVDQSGNYLVTWAEDEGGIMDLWENRFDVATGSWTGAARLVDAIFEDVDSIVVASSASTSMVAWAMQRGTHVAVHAVIYDWSAGEWSEVTEIPGQTLFNASDLALAVDPAGNAIVTWREMDGFFFSRYDATSDSWLDATPFAFAVGGYRGPLVMHAHADGDVTAAWITSGSTQVTQVTRFAAGGGTWSNAASIDSVNPGESNNVVLAAAPNDEVVAIWTRGNRLWWSRHDGTMDTWQVASLLANGPQDYVNAIELVFEETGHAYLSYERRRELWFQRYDSGAGIWSDPKALPFEFYSGQRVGMRIAASGDLLMGHGRSHRAHAVRYDVQADAFGEVEPLEYRDGRVGPVSLAADDSAGAGFVWRMGDDGIWSHHYR